MTMSLSNWQLLVQSAFQYGFVLSSLTLQAGHNLWRYVCFYAARFLEYPHLYFVVIVVRMIYWSGNCYSVIKQLIVIGQSFGSYQIVIKQLSVCSLKTLHSKVSGWLMQILHCFEFLSGTFFAVSYSKPALAVGGNV